MERTLARDAPVPSVVVYNLSNDDFEGNIYAHFFSEAFKATGDTRFRCIHAPWFLDWFRDFLKSRTFPLRHPLGRMMFPPDRLYSTGYTHQYGMAKAHNLAFDMIRRDLLRR